MFGSSYHCAVVCASREIFFFAFSSESAASAAVPHSLSVSAPVSASSSLVADTRRAKSFESNHSRSSLHGSTRVSDAVSGAILAIQFNQSQLMLARGSASLTSFDALDYVTESGSFRSDLSLGSMRKSGLMNGAAEENEFKKVINRAC